MVNEISKINVILYGVETDTAPQKTENAAKKTVVIQTQNAKNDKENQQYSGFDEVCINSNRCVCENNYFLNNSIMYMFQNFMQMMFNFMQMMMNIITLQNLINSQNNNDSELPVFYQTLQENEVGKTDKEDKSYETLVQEAIDALEDDSLSNPAPKAEEKPAPKPAPVVVEQPKAEEKPAPKPAPVVVEQPKAEKKPAPKPAPVVVEQPKAEEKPASVVVVVEQPKAEKKPAPKPAPVVVEQPKAEEKPASVVVVVEQPKVEEKPAPKPAPVVVEQPKVEEKPAPKPAPAVAEQPKAEEKQAPFWDWSKIEFLPKTESPKPKRTHDEILMDDRELMLAMVKRTSKNDAYVLEQIKALNDDDFKKMFCDSSPEFVEKLSEVLYDGYNADSIINYILSRQSQLAPEGKKLVLKVSAGISREASSSVYLIRQADVPKKDTWVNRYDVINGQNISDDFTVSQGDFERFYSEMAAAIK